MELTVDSSAGLQQLRRRRPRGTIRRIRLTGPLADNTAERALNRAYFSCGCEEGSFAVAAALLGSILLGLLRGFDGAFTPLRVALYLAAAAVIGKVAGLAVARLRLRRLRNHLHDRLRAVANTEQ